MESSLSRAQISPPSVRFSTEGLAPRDQFDAWRDRLSSCFGFADISRRNEGPFRAMIETRALTRLAVTEVRGEPMTFDRTIQHIAQRDRDEFTIGLLLEGSGAVEQDGRITRMGPGDLVLCDCVRPFCIRLDEPFRQIVFHCDRAELEARLPDAARRTARRIAGRAAIPSAMADYIASTVGHGPDLGPAQCAIAQHALEVLAFSLGGTSPRDRASQILLARIQVYIEESLSKPALTPGTIARHHRISRRHLYRLFDEIEDSVAGFIRRRRLARSKAMLTSELHQRRSISEIAFACGFTDATTFARAFRIAFGATPRNYRRAAKLDTSARERSSEALDPSAN